MRWENVAMAWTDNKKANDIVPLNWIINCFKMYKISDEVIKFITKVVKNWKVELKAEGKTLAEVKIRQDIFQKDALSP